MIYFKYAASILVALLVCGMQHIAEARRNHRHPHHQFIRDHQPINSLLSFTENSDLLSLFAKYSTVDQPLPVAVEDHSQPTLPFDARETNTTYQILCDLPGIEKKDISLSIKNNELTISAKRNVGTEEDGMVYRRVERLGGEVVRAIVLPEDCEASKIAAESKDGVLTVSIPKLQKSNVEESTVHIKVK